MLGRRRRNGSLQPVVAPGVGARRCGHSAATRRSRRAPPLDPRRELDATEAWWREWVGRCTYDGRRRDIVVRSLITLKALTYGPTGGIVAAPTTSLPEAWGGVRNWDYRYCWIRDATFMLYALASSGYTGEAVAWRDWLLRAVAGEPSSLQILYGIAGERRLNEYELPWLAGYENIDHSRTKAKSPQTNGICERFHKTVLDEFYRVAFRKRIYETIGELQADLDAWMEEYNRARSHQGRWCYGKTPMQTFLDTLPVAREKLIQAR